MDKKSKRITITGDIDRKEMERLFKASVHLEPVPSQMKMTVLKALANWAANRLSGGER